MRELFLKPPEFVVVEGKKYKINTDFRVWIKISEIFSDSDIPFEKKLVNALILAYDKKLPPHFDTAVNALLDFLCLGKYQKKGNTTGGERLLSYSLDEGLIYAAFMKEYNIDLNSAKLHWWSFANLLGSVGEDTMLMKVIGFRGVKCEKIADKNLKSYYRKMKNKYRIKNNTNEENIAKIMEEATV